MYLIDGRSPGRGARRRPVVDPDRRHDPRRQDPDGPAGGRTRTPTSGRHRRPARSAASPRRTRETIVAAGGGGLRRRPGRDRRGRAVRGHGRRTWSTRSCFLTLARTGDQLQGIKKGVLELADVIVVNKADGEHAVEAKAAARELTGAIRSDLPARNTMAATGSHDERDRRPRSCRSCGRRCSNTVRCSPRQASSKPGAGPSRWTGPGRWCATPCWIG